MTGVLLIDKPAGITSHDVVARVRRVTGERSIGHTGTLDPMATGLLPLMVGRATRLASLLSGGEKVYDASVRFGFATTTDDAEGVQLGEAAPAVTDIGRIQAALANLIGTTHQLPPAHSAKKIAGRRAYELARQQVPVPVRPVPVVLHAASVRDFADDTLRLRIRCGPGFYVRALARDLGAALGCGGHLTALRRIRTGSFVVEDAMPLELAERAGLALEQRLIAPAVALPDLPAVQVTAVGEVRVGHGNVIRPQDIEGPWVMKGDADVPVKVIAADGHLLALARIGDGTLHPVVVLG